MAAERWAWSRAGLVLMGMMLAACAQNPQRGGLVLPSAKNSSQPVSATEVQVQSELSRVLQTLDQRTYGGISMAEASGHVLLTGAVVRPDLRRHLENQIQSMPGVAVVVNRVQVTEASALGQFNPDGSKERDLVGRFALPGLAVRVINGVVYLVGVTNRPQDIDALRDALADDPSIKWVDATAVVVTSTK